MQTPAELSLLLASVAKRDEAAFERLYEATSAKLYGVVLRILKRQGLTEEVIQDTDVKIWNSAGQFNPGLASPITWRVSIARNRAIDIVRKRSEIPTGVLLEFFLQLPQPVVIHRFPRFNPRQLPGTSVSRLSTN